MALIKQKISVPFVNGINTKTDEKQLDIGQFSVIENMEFPKIGKFIKRQGYESLSRRDLQNNTLSNLKKLATFKKELCSMNGSDFYSYIESQQRWSNKGTVFTAIPSSTSVIRNNRQQQNLDVIYRENFNIFVYEDNQGVHFTIMDTASQSFVVKKSTLSASGTNPRVLSRNNEIYVTYIDGTSIKYRKFKIFDYFNVDAEATIINDLNATNKKYDAELVSDQINLAYNDTTAQLVLVGLKPDLSVTSKVVFPSESPSVFVSVMSDMSSRTIVTWTDGSDVKAVGYNYNLSAKILTETLIENTSNVVRCTSTETSSGNYSVVYEISASNPYDHYIKLNTINLAASVGTPSIIARSLGIASKIFEHESTKYILTLHKNTLQSTYFLIDLEGNLRSRISPNSGGDLSNDSLPKVETLSSDTFLIVSQIKGRLVEENGTFFSLLGVNSTTIDFASKTQYQNVEAANNLHIAGGFLKMYDGSEIVEHGFHLYPEGLANGGTATTGGSISDGTYEYKAVYAWTDAQGIVHRSAPSEALSVTLSGGTSTQTQTVTVPTLRLTDKLDVIVELYRTEDAGTIFYKVSSTTSPTFNDKTANSVSIVDSASDSDLINNEVLYTTGDVLDNISAPASTIIESFQNRLFVTAPKSQKLNYSKIQFEGFPIEFNDSLELLLPNRGGDTVAIKAMDDKLIIFKEKAIYYLSGDGPNNIGEQDTFIEPELIINNLGCETANSVVLTPEGILFQSDRGIYLLSRGLDLQYVGQPVERYNKLSITSAILVPDKNQVRFTSSDGVALVLNYNVQKWGTFSNHKATSAVTIVNDYYYLRNDDLVYKQSDKYSDNSTSVNAKVETGWISFAGIQNFQRVYRMLLLGAFKSSHKLRIQVAYDYVDAYVQETVINVSDFIDVNAYGTTSPYGANATYGASNLYQMRIDFEKQKCQSMKIKIEEIQSSGGEGLELSNMLFVVGSKDSEGKFDQDKGYGTST